MEIENNEEIIKDPFNNSKKNKGKPRLLDGDQEMEVSNEVTSKINASRSKKNGMQKISEEVVVGSPTTIKEYALNEVVIPKLKDFGLGIVKLVADLLIDAASLTFFGTAESKSRSGFGRNHTASGPMVPYNDIYERRSSIPKRRSSVAVDQLEYSSKRDAETVLDNMRYIIDEQGFVTVAQYYAESGEESMLYTDSEYGWWDLSMSVVEYRRGMYRINLPRPVPIKER